MSSLSDLLGAIQSGVSILAQIEEALAKAAPTNSSGYLDSNALVLSGFVRVLGVSVMGGTSGTATLHDCASLADASATNAIYVISNTAGFYPTNLVFDKGLVLTETAGTTKCAIMYSRS